ncbi:MAG: ATPase domain-containing protein, partial [Actinomycetota bacterium]|nr:ATPase domain-containing protein [Actinomycetota bacterium]
MTERIKSGNEALDRVLGGGFPRNSINVLMGLPGTGKTILAEQVVFANATPESPALYISTLSEPLDKMLRYLQGFDYFDPSLLDDDAVVYADLGDSLRKDGLRGFVDRATELIKEHAPSIVVIDSFKALHLFSEDGRDARHRLSELLSTLSSLATTSFLVGEYSSEEVSAFSEFAVADGIVELVLQKHGVRDARYLRVVKQRGSDFFGGEHAFRITLAGLELFPRLTTPPGHISY